MSDHIDSIDHNHAAVNETALKPHLNYTPLGSPKVDTLIDYLTAHAPRIVPFAELLRAIWGYEDDRSARNTLYVHMNWARKALDDDANAPRHIRAWRCRGYQWIGETTGRVA